MTDKIEHSNHSLPRNLILENFFHGNRFDVKRFATVRCSDGVFKLRNLFRRHFKNPARLLVTKTFFNAFFECVQAIFSSLFTENAN